MQDDDMEVNKAILESIKTAQEQNVFVETLNPIDRKRKVGNPAGLKNIGNSYSSISLTIKHFYIKLAISILYYKLILCILILLKRYLSLKNPTICLLSNLF